MSGYRNRLKIGFALAGAAVMVFSVLAVLAPTFAVAAPATSAPSAASAGAASASSVSLGGPLTQVAPASTYSTTGPTTLPSSLASYYSIAPDSSAYSSTAQIQLQVGLTPSGSLTTLANDVSNPASSMYHDYMTAAGIGSALGVSASTYTSIEEYFAEYGLTVESHADLLTIGLSGTPVQLAEAFHTQVQAFAESYSNSNYYNPIFDQVVGVENVTTASGQTYEQPVWQSTPYVFYANTAGLTLPAGIAKYVASVAGFGDQIAQPQVQPLYENFPGVASSATDVFNTTNGTWDQIGGPGDWGKRYTPPDPFSLGSNCAANYSWAPWYYYGTDTQIFFPSTMPTLEGACTLFTGADTILSEPDYGQGVTIAVVEVGCIDPTQLADFSALTFPSGHYPNGLTTSVLSRTTYVALGASSLTDCENQGIDWGWYLETALDVEYAATMAPEAHIDLVSVPTPNFSAFDEAYSFIMTYLTHTQVCSIPSSDPILGPVFVYGPTSDANGGSACQVSITSNSYGSGETYTTYYGNPMYITFESQLLEELALNGVTSFFANGDSGGVYAVVEDFMPADSPGTISVGGGMMTASDNGVEFPAPQELAYLESSSIKYPCDYYATYYCSISEGDVVAIDQVTSLQSYTYWAYPSYEGTFSGEVGGGFGQSIETPQAWYEAGNATYVDGARIDPYISNAAAFNMSIYYQICESFDGLQLCYGPWNYLYGGTSFATPISAGGWALVEEQLNQRFGPGAAYTGDIGPLLFGASNAYLAGASTVDPFVPMSNIGVQTSGVGTYAPFNSFTWYYENLSIQVPNAVDHPWWSDSLFNPMEPPGWTDAKFIGGSSVWNFLQGLGVPDWDLLDQVLVGASDSSHALANDPFFVEQVTPTGDVDISTLTCGVSTEFQIVTVTATGNAAFDVKAYSGTPEDGTAYGGGITTDITVNPATDPSLTFWYTPLCPPPTNNGPQSLNNTGWFYGYFLTVQEGSNPLGGNAWNFQQFGDQAVAVGTLNLCISDVEDICQSSVAEETMFNTYDLEGQYNLQGQANALVTLTETNGEVTPVESATVAQVSVVTTLCPSLEIYYTEGCDPTLLPSTYAPGVEIGHYLTDSKGTADIWDNAFIAEASCQTPILGLDNEYGDDTGGSQPVIPPECLQTQVYTITAYFDGLVSNTVTVYVEPQMGSFWPQLTLSDGHVTGFVEFADMTNVQYVNVSVGGAPGEFDNVSFLPDCAPPGIVSVIGSDGLTYFPENPGSYCYSAADSPYSTAFQTTCQAGDPSAFADSFAWLCGSGVKEGVIEVDLTAPTSGPTQVSLLAVGWNDLSINEGCFESECYVFPDVQYGIYWQDPLVFLTTALSASATGTVTGVDTFSFSGTAFGAATGQLSLVSSSGTTVLATGLSGSYALNTANLADGNYQVVYTEVNTAGAVAQKQVISIYADNAQAGLSATISSLTSELSNDGATIASLQGQISTLNSELAADAASIASLDAQVSSLNSQLATLQSQLAAAQATITADQAQIATLQASNGADAAQISQLESQLATAQATISSDASQISSLQAQVAQLQQELANAQKSKPVAAAPTAWYDYGGGAVIVLLVAVGAIAGMLGTYAVTRYNRRPTVPETPSQFRREGAQPSPTDRQKGLAGLDEGTQVESPDALRRAVIRSINHSVAVQRALVNQGEYERAARLNDAANQLRELYEERFCR